MDAILLKKKKNDFVPRRPHSLFCSCARLFVVRVSKHNADESVLGRKENLGNRSSIGEKERPTSKRQSSGCLSFLSLNFGSSFHTRTKVPQ